MTVFFAILGIGIIVWAFNLKGLPIMTSAGLMAGCFCLIIAAITIDAPIGEPDCWVDWDARSNRTMCD